MTEHRTTSPGAFAEVLDRLLEQVMQNETPSFRALAKAAALDPARDFVGASLCDLDFRDEDLRGFNFSNADLSGTDFRRANIQDVNFKEARLDGAIGLPVDFYQPFWLVIVASGDSHQLTLLGNIAAQLFAGRDGMSKLHVARSVQEVRSAIKKFTPLKNTNVWGRPSNRELLLIVQAGLPSKGRIGPKHLSGVTLIQEIAQSPKYPTSFILVSEDVEELSIAESIPRCEILLVDSSTNIDQSLRRAVTLLGKSLKHESDAPDGKCNF